jgi:quinol monooxygenase YgiN
MLTVIAEIRTRPGQHHRQAVLDQFAKIIPTVLKEEGCHGYAPMDARRQLPGDRAGLDHHG